jgi:predicted transcriptional regulator YdeE
MEPKIVELEAMPVLGVMGPVDSGDAVGDLWEPEFTRRMKEIQRMAVIPDRYYGVSFDEDGHTYLAGMVVEPPPEIPGGLVLREIPAGTYARFEGPFHEWWMQEGPGWVHETWLPESPFELNRTTSMRDFVVHGVENWVTFYVPVREKP